MMFLWKIWYQSPSRPRKWWTIYKYILYLYMLYVINASEFHCITFCFVLFNYWRLVCLIRVINFYLSLVIPSFLIRFNLHNLIISSFLMRWLENKISKLLVSWRLIEHINVLSIIKTVNIESNVRFSKNI